MERLTHPRSSGIKTGHWSLNKKDELTSAWRPMRTPADTQEIYGLKAGTILKALGWERGKE